MRLNSRLARFWRQILSYPPELDVLVAIFAFAAASFTFLKLLSEMLEGETYSADQAILLALREANDPSNLIGPQWLESVCRDLTSLGSPIVLALITLAVICYLWIDGKRAVALFVAIASAGGAVLAFLLKLGFARPRPELVSHLVSVDSFSFPSAHATMATVTYLTLGVLLARVKATAHEDLPYLAGTDPRSYRWPHARFSRSPLAHGCGRGMVPRNCLGPRLLAGGDLAAISWRP
jgi:membrane-associated phospholipid phosphatase